MKTRLVTAACLAALAAAAFSASFAAEDAEEKLPEGCACPVSGAPAKIENAVAHLGKQVYFCCENCPTAYKKDREKFAAKATHQLLQTAQIAQVACPFSGGKLNPETAIEVMGVSVAFCCENCQAKAVAAVEKDEAVALIFAKLDKGFTLQNKCPVSGQAIDAAQMVEYEGKQVYFCCENCPAAFKAEPEKFLSKLPQFAEEEEGDDEA